MTALISGGQGLRMAIQVGEASRFCAFPVVRSGSMSFCSEFGDAVKAPPIAWQTIRKCSLTRVAPVATLFSRPPVMRQAAR